MIRTKTTLKVSVFVCELRNTLKFFDSFYYTFCFLIKVNIEAKYRYYCPPVNLNRLENIARIYHLCNPNPI